MKTISLLLVFSLLLSANGDRTGENEEYLKFPSNFLVGAATAAYQIEGAWNVSDKGESIWDRFSHEARGKIFNNETGDVACDSYHKFREDVALLKQVGMKAYRFSLSWARLLPTGFGNKVSQDGLTYYNNLVDELLKNNIEPMATIYHWDHPQSIEDAGGWLNPKIIDWFTDYARIVFREFAHKIKKFVVINEPADYCLHVYNMGIHAPAKVSLRGVAEYLCTENMLKTYATVYRMYQREFKELHNGKLGINVHMRHFYPKFQNDTASAEIAFQFTTGWMLHPIYTEKGDYPELMKKMIAEKSKQQGFSKSRLPELGTEWIDRIRGTSDFLTINHYTSLTIEPGTSETAPSYFHDQGITRSYDPSWPATISPWLKIVPQGFGEVLRKLALEYNNPEIYVTENGVSGANSIIEDDARIRYYREYVKEMLLAVNRDGVNVKGYFVWSFLDSFEWDCGYSQPFGIVHVNFTDPARKRTLKKSAHWWKAVIDAGTLMVDEIPSSWKPTS